MTALTLFQPEEGAVLDLESLKAAANAPHQVLAAWMQTLWPGGGGLVLSGLELNGTPGTSALATVLMPPAGERLEVSPGLAVLPAQDGRQVVIEVREPLTARMPRRDELEAGGAVLVLAAPAETGALADAQGGALKAARVELKPRLGFVKPERLEQPARGWVPLALCLESGNEWAVDLRRVWQPDARGALTLSRALEATAARVWRADPEGKPWETAVFGKNWLLYQVTAASAIESARAALCSQPMTTLQRARLIGGVLDRLLGSVERGANHLVQALGGAAAAPPFRDLISRAARPGA